MFEIGNLVTIKPEFLDNKETIGRKYRIVDVNSITKRCFIELAESDLPLNPQELVSFDMIEKVD